MVSLSKMNNTSNVNVNVKPNVSVSVGTPTPAPPATKSTTETAPTQTPTEAPTTPEINNVYANLESSISPDISINAYASVKPGSVSYSAMPYTEDEFKRLKNENEVLKIIIDIQRNNPLIYNGYIIADDEKLMKFIQLLTFADDVQLDADDLGQGCVSKKTYRKVHAIYVIKDGETKNLKYDYPRVMKELTDLGISTKFVW